MKKSLSVIFLLSYIDYKLKNHIKLILKHSEERSELKFRRIHLTFDLSSTFLKLCFFFFFFIMHTFSSLCNNYNVICNYSFTNI